MNTKIEPIRKLEVHESWELPWVCWGLVKDRYSDALVVSLIMVAIYTPISIIPYIGGPVGTFVLTFLLFGIVKICRTWENSGSHNVSDLFIGMTDARQRDRILPLAGILAGCSLMASLLIFGMEVLTRGSLWGTAMSFPVMMGMALLQSALSFFSISLLAFHEDIQPTEALKLSLDTYFANLIPMVLVGLVILVIAVVCLICFVLPILFFFVPLTLPAFYFVYRAVFEGLELKSGD